MISIKDVEKLAALSRMRVTPEEAEALRRDMDSILGYVGEIQKVSVEAGAARAVGTLRNVLREDTEPHESGAFTEVLLAAAPQRDGNYIKVKKIL